VKINFVGWTLSVTEEWCKARIVSARRLQDNGHKPKTVLGSAPGEDVFSISETNNGKTYIRPALLVLSWTLQVQNPQL
jgi:hypothetical protein